jgi:hypothetical protein
MKNNPVQNIVREVVTSYVTTSQVLLVGSIVGLGIVGICPAQAATFTYSGTTTGAPTWHRPNANGNNPPTSLHSDGLASADPYDVFSFTVDASGSYSFTSTSSYDNYGFLYQGSFNPTAQFTNVIIGDDDSAGGSGNYGFTMNLSTGTNYFLVSTGFHDSDFGAFTTTIDGLGNVSGGAATSVPEPFTIIGTLVGGTAAMRMRKKLKSVDKE